MVLLSNVCPRLATISMSASMAVFKVSMLPVRPSNMARRIIIAAVGTATATRLTHAMMFITECDFGENIYRSANLPQSIPSLLLL